MGEPWSGSIRRGGIPSDCEVSGLSDLTGWYMMTPWGPYGITLDVLESRPGNLLESLHVFTCYKIVARKCCQWRLLANSDWLVFWVSVNCETALLSEGCWLAKTFLFKNFFYISDHNCNLCKSLASLCPHHFGFTPRHHTPQINYAALDFCLSVCHSEAVSPSACMPYFR